jgi:hypothetical protein
VCYELNENILFDDRNDDLLNATWHYNACRYTEHEFENDCDADCSVCGYVRTPADHVYDDGEDLTCNVCGAERILYIPGDLDQNGAVNSADAIYLLYHTLFGEGRYPVNQPVDYDKNGTVSSADAIYLLYHTLFGSGRYPLQ